MLYIFIVTAVSKFCFPEYFGGNILVIGGMQAGVHGKCPLFFAKFRPQLDGIKKLKKLLITKYHRNTYRVSCFF
jgi:hypothetical protein